MAPILNKCRLAAISFQDRHGLHIRIYYQDDDGNIRERDYDHSSWHRPSKDIVGKGKKNTGIAAITWDNGQKIRVYFLSEENQVVERCYNGGAAGSWFDGSLATKNQFIAAPYSQVAAVGFGSGLKCLRVYYQDSGNYLHEVVFDPEDESWSDGNLNLPIAVPETSIASAASTAIPDELVWVYYQKPDMKLVEYIMDPNGNWTPGGFVSEEPYGPGACLSAVIWGNIQIRVFAINDMNTMIVTAYTNGGWQDTVPVSTVTTEMAIAAIKLHNTRPESVRVYLQPPSIISEFGSNDGIQDWVLMMPFLPIAD